MFALSHLRPISLAIKSGRVEDGGKGEAVVVDFAYLDTLQYLCQVFRGWGWGVGWGGSGARGVMTGLKVRSPFSLLP